MSSPTAAIMRRVAEREVARGGGRVRRPAGEAEVDIAYVRSGPSDGLPIVVIPGGPGLASAVPYRALRREAAHLGLNLVMMEHRGIGLSRFDTTGAPLTRAAVTAVAAADDLAAVLDDAGIERAVVFGSSYGTYLAELFGVRHPQRVAAMVLDSPILDVLDDLATTRAYRRELLVDGPGETADAVRTLVKADVVPAAELGQVITSTYEMCGPDVVRRLAAARALGKARVLWKQVAKIGEAEFDGASPYIMEPDLVAGIAYGELGYAHDPDGLPLDPVAPFAAHSDEPFTGEPVSMVAELPRFTWPTAVIACARDMQTPPPVSRRIADLVPGAVLVELPDLGHSVLDSHRRAAQQIMRAMRDGEGDRLPQRADELVALPKRGSLEIIAQLIRGGVAVGAR
ncbi:alpha/beta fold hydrolase [Gordonia sp. (in: high G+C Gram-positive bacteria)]|uniref:alpha/beta fold hydrolase n=1 Tax=Gordonia sp. (in: high G+C Gram-positive bacteria) TaxID=84139 RepID=UPI0039E6B232